MVTLEITMDIRKLSKSNIHPFFYLSHRKSEVFGISLSPYTHSWLIFFCHTFQSVFLNLKTLLTYDHTESMFFQICTHIYHFLYSSFFFCPYTFHLQSFSSCLKILKVCYRWNLLVFVVWKWMCFPLILGSCVSEYRIR